MSRSVMARARSILRRAPATSAARSFLRSLRGRLYVYAWWLQEWSAGKKAVGTSVDTPDPVVAAAIARALVAARGGSTSGAIAAFAGLQETPRGGPIELWNLLRDLPGHPAGSTVTRATIEKAGHKLPAPSRRNPPQRALIWVGDDPAPPKKPAKPNPRRRARRSAKSNPPERPRGIPDNATLIYPKGRFSRGFTWYGIHRSGGRYKHKFRSDTVKAMYGLPGGGIAFIPKRGRLWGFR